VTIRTVIVLVLSLICGVSAALGVNLFWGTPVAAVAKPETTPVVVAAVDIPRGTSLQLEVLRTERWPPGLVPAGAVSEVEHVLDRATLAALVAGEPVLKSRISENGLGAAALIRPGMRAYTILTPTASAGVAGFVLPGNRVDVLLTIQGQRGGTGGGSTSTLLQNVEILAADQRLDHGKNGDAKQKLQSVTLLVTPDMAAKLTLAQSLGTLHLSLRNDADTALADTRPVTMQELQFSQEGFTESVVNEEEDVEEDVEVVPSPELLTAPAVVFALRGSSWSTIYITRP
jgi:pilus assembly protein CpaB